MGLLKSIKYSMFAVSALNEIVDEWIRRMNISYANIGTHGIDGCMSSFLGQASVRKELSFLVIGDLAFFYDMNVLRIRHISPSSYSRE